MLVDVNDDSSLEKREGDDLCVAVMRSNTFRNTSKHQSLSLLCIKLCDEHSLCFG